MKRLMILVILMFMIGCNSNDISNHSTSSTSNEQLTRSVFTNSSFIEEKVLTGDFSKNGSLNVFTNSSK